MLQICSPCQTTNAHFKQTNTLNLPTCHAAQTLQVSNLLPSKPVTWLQLQVLIAKQIWPLQAVANLQPLPSKFNTLNLPTCHCKSAKVQHCKALGLKAPRALVKPPQLTGQRLPSYTNLHRLPTAGLGCKTDLATARCCSPCQPDHAPTLHCQANPTL